MNCLNPVTLKSGIVVPCGQCELCRSDRRNEWSIRLAIHLQNCVNMPLFITLTYDDGHLPLIGLEDGITFRKHWPGWNYHNRDSYTNLPTLMRWDVSTFLKRYKRKYSLKNETFQYFGCGEYGGKFGRPHYHLLFFGDDELYKMFMDNSEDAQSRVSEVWRLGFVHIGIAGFDGVHYVTKYCLKEDVADLHDYQVKPFTICSNGIGMNFFDSDVGHAYKVRLEWCQRNKEKIFRQCPDFDSYDIESVNRAIDYLERKLPSNKVILDDGRTVFLPRAIRKKLVGSFEHFKDSPLWLLTHLRMLRDSFEYYKQYGVYDSEHSTNHSYQQCLTRVEKIRKRLLESKYNNKRLSK